MTSNEICQSAFQSPPLSASIRRLEAQLGVALFARNRRGTELTLAGAAALDDARRAVFHGEQFTRAAQAASRGEAGTLRVGFVGSATYALMPRVLPRFRKRYPARAACAGRVNDRAHRRTRRERRHRVGLVRFPLGSACRARVFPVERDVFVAALPAGHQLARKRQLALSDLAQELFVMYGAAEVPGLHAAALMACQQAGFLPRVRKRAV